MNVTRQRENVLVALENWDLVQKYAQTGANSAGTAMEKYDIVLDSVSAKQEQLNAKVQEFYMNILNSGLIKGLLDVGKAFMDMVNWSDGLVGKLSLLTAGTVAWIFTLNALKGTKFGGLIAQFFAVAQAEGVATAGGKALNVVLNTLKAHPIVFAISALIAVLMLAKTAFDHFNVTIDEQREKLSEAKSAYEEITNTLSKYNEELETTKSRIKELESSTSLSIVEKEELENLKQLNADLERNIALEKIRQDQANKEKNKAFVDTMKKDVDDKGEYSVYSRDGSIAKGASWWKNIGYNGSGSFYSDTTEEVNIDKQFEAYKNAQDKLSQLKQDYIDKKITEDEYNAQKEAYDTQIQDIASYLTTKSKEFSETAKDIEYIPNPQNDDDKAVNAWLDYINEFNDKYLLALGDTEAVTALWTSIFTRDKFSEAKEALDELGKDGETTAEEISNAFKDNKDIQEFIDYLIQLGLIEFDADFIKEYDENLDGTISTSEASKASTEDLTEAFGGLANQIEDTSDKAQEMTEAVGFDDIFANYANQIQSLSEQYEILSKAQEEYNEYGNLTASTMQKIIDNGLLGYLDVVNGKLTFNTQALQTNADATRNNAIAKLQEALFTDLQSIALGTYQATVDATDASSANAQLQSFQSELSKTTGQALTTAGAIATLNASLGTSYQFSDTQKAQADAVVANYNAMVSKVNALTTNLSAGTYRSKSSGSGGSGSKSKSSKEWWETQLEKLKDQLDYNIITMDTYISGIEKVLGKLKKGTEAWNEVNAELQKAKLDKLDNQFDRGEISIDWYITKLTELRKAYKKGTEGYKELTKTINDTKLDAIENKFDRGEYSYDYYITKLKEIRSEYAKTTEDYKELTKTINDATLENLGNKYERGEISYSDYTTQLNTLRKSYAKTTEEYKEISATITETAIDNFDKQMDAIESRMSQIGDVNTDEERVEYAQLLAQKYKTVSDRVEFIRKEMQRTDITAEQRLLLEENLNDLLEEQIDLRDEIEDEVREYYENQKEQLEQQAELNRKELLYRKELELYGLKGKELYEWETNQKIKAIEAQIELREAERDALDEINERQELENDLLEAKLKLQNALNNKTTKVLKRQADGTWQYEYSANMADVKSAKEEVKDAEKALDDYDFEQSIQALQDKADKLNENMEDLAEKYEEAEFWADREYEQTMNGINKVYGDIDALVEKWMNTYGDSTTELTTSYQSLVSANVKLEDALTQLATAIESKYETVGTNKVSSVDGVKSFDTGGKIVGNGLILAHDKERVLTERQNISFENFISKIPQLLKVFDVTRFDGLISGKIAEAKVNADKTASTVISKVECVFPNITSTDGLQRAILELPRLALQKK